MGHTKSYEISLSCIECYVKVYTVLELLFTYLENLKNKENEPWNIKYGFNFYLHFCSNNSSFR